jgi:hypothetical protein
MLRAYCRSLKTLSHLLSDDYDLAVMRAILLLQPETFSDTRDLKDTLGRIERRQVQLKAQAHVLGRRIFAERSAHFRKRLSHYWQAWEDETGGHDAQQGAKRQTAAISQRAMA